MPVGIRLRPKGPRHAAAFSSSVSGPNVRFDFGGGHSERESKQLRVLQRRTSSSPLSKSGQESEATEFVTHMSAPAAEVPVSVSEFPVASEELPDPLLREIAPFLFDPK